MKRKIYRYQNNNINLFRENLSLVNKYIISFNTHLSNQLANNLLKKVSVLCKHRGSIYAITWIKDLRVAMYAAIGKYKVTIPFLPLYKDGYPKAFGPEITKLLREGDLKTIRYVLTLLQVSRYLEGQKEADFTPITDNSTFTPEIRKEFKEMVGKSLANLRVSPREAPRWSKPHFTSKGSPSGPAVLSLKHDLIQLPDKLIKDIGIVGGDVLETYINELKSNLDIITTTKEPKPEKFGRLRALGLVEDTEAKTRVIAMANCWTQTSLTPLHEDLLQVLRKIRKVDLTFGQDIRPFGKDENKYYSFDLTSATDRLPRFLYVDVLENLYGKEYSLSWESILVDYPFHSPDGVIRKYNTGQPMGVYSSWPLLALVHHTIVQVAALRSGLRRFVDYRILGDDIVIRNNEVAVQYQLILKQLGVGISKTKTLISDETFEFAKRLFHKGIEVTAFPVHGISSSIVSGWQDLYSVLETASKRNFGSLDTLVMPRLIKSLYRANAVPFYLASLNPEQRGKLGKITPSIRSSSRAKAARIGELASAYIDTFYIISTLKAHETIFQRFCDFWRMRVGCTTNTKLALHEAVGRYVMELDSELTRVYTVTLDSLKTRLKVKENRDLMPLLMFGPEYFLGDDLKEPLTWIMIDQAKRIQETVMNPPNVPDDELYLDEWTLALRNVDLRITDPTIFDRSRRFQRDMRLKSSCSIKALASIRKEVLKLLPGTLRADKAHRDVTRMKR
jgi:hypothetical protein